LQNTFEQKNAHKMLVKLNALVSWVFLLLSPRESSSDTWKEENGDSKERTKKVLFDPWLPFGLLKAKSSKFGLF
jgi:hypothetical protein